MLLNKKLILPLLFASTVACAGGQEPVPTDTPADTNDNIQFTITPYLWAINMNGYVGVASLSSQHVSQDFSDIMQNFDAGGMLYLEAKKNGLCIFFNGLYAALSQTVHVGSLTINTTNGFGLFSGGVSYETFDRTFQNGSELSVEPYLGVRDTLNDATVSIANTNLSASLNEQWVDPILGARVNYNITKAWLTVLAADVGGLSSSDYSFNANGYIGYKPQTMMKNMVFYLGYRWLHQNYQTGANTNYFSWNMDIFGPVVGISFVF